MTRTATDAAPAPGSPGVLHMVRQAAVELSELRWADIIVKLGVPSAIAIGLVYWMAFSITARQDAQAAATVEMRQEHLVLGFYLRSICIGVHKDETVASAVLQCTPPDRIAPAPPSLGGK